MHSYKRESTLALSLLLLFSVALAQTAPKSPPNVTVTSTSQPIVHEGVAVTLKVDDFQVARQKAIDAAQALGGKVADAKVGITERGRKNGWMRIEVPADQLNAYLPQVYALGKLYGDKMLTADKTSEYETLARRMDELDKHQTRLSGVLEQPRKMRGSDILYLQERLFRAGVDKQDLAQTRIDIARRAGTANVILSMFEPYAIKVPPPMPHTVSEHVAARFSDAWISFRRFGLHMVSDLAFLLVYAVVWLPITIAVLLIGKWAWKRLKQYVSPPNGPVSSPPATPA